jgi:hypothetical protein
MCDALALGVTGIRAVALSAVRLVPFAGAAVR